ncbi:MAG: NAD-dependent epimerase/dehydratase family protein [Candidatus Dadabacteria bacterium]
MQEQLNKEQSFSETFNKENDVVLVTGGSGFIGAYTISNLVQKGYRVRAMRRGSKEPFFIPPEIMNKVEWAQGNVLDVIALADAMQDVTAIVHAAAVVSFEGSTRNEMYQVNIEGTANVVNMALENNVRRFLHVSSVSALGRTVNGEKVNEEKKWQASKTNTHYAVTKYHSEIHVWRGIEEGLSAAIINPSTVLGYGDWNESSCAIFKNVYNEFPWYTKGVNGFVGVEDVAEVIVQLLFTDINERRFVVNGDNWSFEQLFATIAKYFGKNPPTRHATLPLGELAWRWEKLKSLVTSKRPLLTRETAKIAQSETYFDSGSLLEALPSFRFTPLEEVIKKSCEKYLNAVKEKILIP